MNGIRSVTTWLSACLSMFCSLVLIDSAEAKKPSVGVYYFPGWYRTGGESFKAPYDEGSDWSEWRGAIAKAPSPRPLAGFYDDSDPRLWSYYISWMRGHGIDFIAFDWYHNAGEDYLYESLDRGFLGAAENKKMQFCLTWCNHGGYWWSKPIDQSARALTEMMDRVSNRYLHRPNYLKHDGKPVFMIYEVDLLLSQNGGVKPTRDALEAMRQTARKHGHPGLYLVAVYSYYSPDIIEQLQEIGFDAFCGYNYVGLKSARVNWDSKNYPYRDVADRLIDYIYPHLEKTGEEKGIPYWPTVFAGWDNSPRIGTEATVLTDNTPSEFGRLFGQALKHVNPASPFLIVEAWNEWGENSFIEPSKQHGFGYLREMAFQLGRKPPLNVSVPSKEEISSWSILSPEELKVAEANELKEKVLEEPKWFQFGENEEASLPKMPVTISFGSNGITIDKVYVKNMEIIERDEKGVTFKTKGGECGIELSIEKIPTHSVRKLTVYAELMNPEASVVPISCEFYWATSYMPNFSPFASVFTLLRSGQPITIATKQLPGWQDTGTPLTRLRLDLGRKKGLLIRIERIVLE